MDDFVESLRTYLPKIDSKEILVTVVFAIVCLIISRLGVVLVARACRPRFGQSGSILVQRLLWYPLLLVFVSNALSRLGVDMSVLLGAAGVLTVAAGFAAQTSAANVISGLFLLGEHPFSIGDVIRFDEVLGTVVAVDLLSVKVCTFDNLLVRIPNEVMLKKNVTNLSHFKIRRVEIPLCIANDEDLSVVLDTLKGVATELSCCLDEPEPMFIYNGFSRSGQDITYCVWGLSSEYLAVRNQFQKAAKDAFDEAGLKLGVEHRTVEAMTPQNASLRIEMLSNSDKAT